MASGLYMQVISACLSVINFFEIFKNFEKLDCFEKFNNFETSSTKVEIGYDPQKG